MRDNTLLLVKQYKCLLSVNKSVLAISYKYIYNLV